MTKKNKKSPSKGTRASSVPVLETTRALPIASLSWWERDWLFAVVLAMVTAVAYMPAWRGLPIWDDNYHLTRPDLQSWAGLSRIWLEPGLTPQYYPLTHTVFWIEHQLWGDATLGYHMVNILLHTTIALLLLRILRRLKVPGAPLAAALFALHPIQVETVAWMTELKNTLSGTLCLSAALVYFGFDQKRRWNTYAFALGLFILALLSKTVVATLPAALLVIFWWKRGKLSWKQDVLPLIPLFVLSAGFGLLTARMEQSVVGATGSEFEFSLLDRCLIAGRAIWFYLGKLVWPAPLIFIYPRWQISSFVWWQYLFPAAALGVALALWSLREKSRAPLAVFLLFAGTLFPALGFVSVYPFRYSLVADHFQYLACIAPLSLASSAVSIAFSRLTTSLARTAQPLFGILLLATLTTLTWRQSVMYSDIETLWQTTIDRNRDCWMAWGNLGLIQFNNGQLEPAITKLETALSIKPDFVDALNGLGLALAQKGLDDKAIPQFEKAIEVQPGYAPAYNNLATVQQERGQLDAAIANYKSALAIKPDYTSAHYNLGIAYRDNGQLDEAISEFEKVLAFKSDDAEAHFELGSALQRRGRTSEAIAQYQLALTINPDDADALHSLAAGYAETGRIEEALAKAELALQLARTHSNTVLAETLQKEIERYKNQRGRY